MKPTDKREAVGVGVGVKDGAQAQGHALARALPAHVGGVAGGRPQELLLLGQEAPHGLVEANFTLLDGWHLGLSPFVRVLGLTLGERKSKIVNTYWWAKERT